jgi:hypothetical protein
MLSRKRIYPPCPHGRTRKAACALCTPCPHGKNKYKCTKCCPALICEHGFGRRDCRVCNPKKFCEHGVARRNCKICLPCPHGKAKTTCILCMPCLLCEHGKRWSNCPKCRPNVRCEHGKTKAGCTVCTPCPHGMLKHSCIVCTPDMYVKVRRNLHAFDDTDEQRFQRITLCDWCGLPFEGETPDIDHDHSCCDNKKPGGRWGKHCHACTRGFVHSACNRMAIAYCEWVEDTFGIVDEKLTAYRQKFPRRATTEVNVTIVA